MKMQFGVDDTQNLTPSLETGDRQSNWWIDLATHGRLKAELDVQSRRQTHLMEVIRKGQKAQPCRAPATSVARAMAGQGVTPRTSAEVARDEDMTVPAAKAELAELDRQVNEMADDLRMLETTILTRDPQTIAETGAILRLLSGMLTSGMRIDEDYLADILETAAEPCGTRQAVPVQPAH